MQNKELYDIIMVNDFIITENMSEGIHENYYNKNIDSLIFDIQKYKDCDKRLLELFEKQIVIVEKLKNNIYPGLDEYVKYCFSPILLNSYEF